MIARRTFVTGQASLALTLAASRRAAAQMPGVDRMSPAQRLDLRSSLLAQAREKGLLGPSGASALGTPGEADRLELASLINNALDTNAPAGSRRLAVQASSLLTYENRLLRDGLAVEISPVGAAASQAITLDAATRQTYLTQFAQAKIRERRAGEANFPAEISAAATIILSPRAMGQYKLVEQASGVPWFIIGALHYRECSLNFLEHLHNGDSLMKKTHQVPAGRPKGTWPPLDKTGKVVTDPVLLWRISAVDALGDISKKVHMWKVAEMCFGLETYNGTGYFYHRPVQTPYLWNYTQFYNNPPQAPAGGFPCDHCWSSSYVSKQAGLIMIVKELQSRLPSEVVVSV